MSEQEDSVNWLERVPAEDREICDCAGHAIALVLSQYGGAAEHLAQFLRMIQEGRLTADHIMAIIDAAAEQITDEPHSHEQFGILEEGYFADTTATEISIFIPLEPATAA